MKNQILKVYEVTYKTGSHFEKGTLKNTIVSMKLRAVDKEAAQNMAKYIRPNWTVLSIELLKVPENNYTL